ncbi:MAG: pyridoxal-phosphate dependent enzyme [Planctomycetota bacterium]|nr:pyridoxal-phosphate dependent enzyme [Planctomycetota bacterium]
MNASSPTLAEFQRAATLLRDIIQPTPLIPLHRYQGDSDILLKAEIHQPVHSFKIRGVWHAVASLNEQRRQAGVSTVSAGNTAQALAWAAQRFGVSARSLMPDSAPASKIKAVEAYGGEPVLVPVDELFRYLREHLWEQEPYAFIHPWTDRDVLVGHGTIGLEIHNELPEVDTVLIPVGGGGLLGGVASALKSLRPQVRIIAVEPESCPALARSLDAGKPVSVPCNTICDGVAVPYITAEMFPLLQRLVDRVVLVSEDDVRSTIRILAIGNKMVAEPSAALATAASLALPHSERGLSVCLVTGGNLNPAVFADIVRGGAPS